ncbi:MAG TPA: O-antigen ligase family protein [bacterium]|jgi:putative inorganic carbon (HCO3(-)) transporter|nr:O-antigen ligase family protein [bacterium]
MGSRLVQLCAMVLVLVLPLVFNPFGPDAYAGIKVQVLYALTALLVVAWAAAAALRASPPWRLTTPELAVWVFWLAVLLSSVTSVNLRLSIFGAPGRDEGVLAVTSYVVLFFVGAQFFGSASGARRLAAIAGLAAAVTIAYGFIQMAVPPLFEGEAIIRSWYGATGLPRIFSTLGSPIVFGGYLTVIVPVALALALSASPPRSTLWLAIAAAGLVAAVLTFTRAAWVALAVAMPLFFVLAGRTAWWTHRRAIATGAAVAVVVAVVLLMRTGDLAPAAERAASTLTLQTGSASQRVYIWEQTLGLIRQRPLLGWGLETLREVFPYDRAALERYFGRRPVIIDKAHNDVLQVAVSVGLPGAAVYVAVWILVLLAAYRLWRRTEGASRVIAAGLVAAFTGYLFQAQFSFSTVGLAPLAWLLAGAAAGWEVSVSRSIPASPRASSRRLISTV